MAQKMSDSRYRPKKLRKIDLESPIMPDQRMLPDDMLENIHRRKMDRVERHRKWDDRQKRRTKHYIVGAILSLLIINYLFTWTGHVSLLVQIPVYALYGVYLAFMRPGPAHAALITIACGLLTTWIGGLHIGPLALALSAMLWGGIGCAVGAAEMD